MKRQTIFILFTVVSTVSCIGQQFTIDKSIVLNDILTLETDEVPRVRMYFFKGERIDYPQLDKTILSIFRNFVLGVNKQKETDIFVPKNGLEKKFSLVEGIKENQKWTFKVIEYGHKKSDIGKLTKILEKQFNSAEIDYPKALDIIYLPIEYFDKDQLEKL